jgi:hypothetical protein
LDGNFETSKFIFVLLVVVVVVVSVRLCVFVCICVRLCAFVCVLSFLTHKKIKQTTQKAIEMWAKVQKNSPHPKKIVPSFAPHAVIQEDIGK